MAWSYSGDPSSSNKDEIRFYLGDTDPDFPLLTDEEITFLHEQWKDIYDAPLYTAAVAAEALAAKFAKEINVSADGVSVAVGELQDRYNRLAESLRDQYKAKYGLFDPVTAEKMLSIDWDPDIPALVFGIGFMDNYMAGRQNYGDYHPGRTLTWAADASNEPIVVWP